MITVLLHNPSKKNAIHVITKSNLYKIKTVFNIKKVKKGVLTLLCFTLKFLNREISINKPINANFICLAMTEMLL